MITIQTLLSIVATNDWHLQQLDINIVFLHRDLEEDVYMKPPPGLLVPSKNLVCKLNKSIYGIKQASRQWNKKLTISLINLGFCQSKVDYSLFTKKYNSSFIGLC